MPIHPHHSVKGRRADLGDTYWKSAAEANYARWLRSLQAKGEIVSWEYEPKTFWFDGIRRGTTSYKPDFKVVYPDGHHEYHETKGHFDAKSRVKLERMARYHPDEKVLLIGADWFSKMNRSGMADTIPGWERPSSSTSVDGAAPVARAPAKLAQVCKGSGSLVREDAGDGPVLCPKCGAPQPTAILAGARVLRRHPAPTATPSRATPPSDVPEHLAPAVTAIRALDRGERTRDQLHAAVSDVLPGIVDSAIVWLEERDELVFASGEGARASYVLATETAKTSKTTAGEGPVLHAQARPAYAALPWQQEEGAEDWNAVAFDNVAAQCGFAETIEVYAPARKGEPQKVVLARHEIDQGNGLEYLYRVADRQPAVIRRVDRQPVQRRA